MKRALLILALFLFAAKATGATLSLKGVKSLDVVVEDLHQAAEELGLSKETIKTDVELRLRRAGFRVSSEETGYLYVNVIVLKVRAGYFAVAINLEFNQNVRVELNGVSGTGVTWNTGQLVLTGKPEYVREVIGDGVDKFINALLEANPLPRNK